MTTPSTPRAMTQNPSMQGVTDFVTARPQRRFPGWYDETGAFAFRQSFR